MMDVFDKCVVGLGPLGKYAHQAEGYYMFPKLEGEIAPRMQFYGKTVITWSLNNYLGLANHPEVRKADTEATRDWGLAYPMGARIMSGNTVYHEQFENQLAEFVKKPFVQCDRGFLLFSAEMRVSLHYFILQPT